MMMEAEPGTTLEMIQAQVILGALEILFDLPAGATQFQATGLGGRPMEMGQVVIRLRVARRQEAHHRARQLLHRQHQAAARGRVPGSASHPSGLPGRRHYKLWVGTMPELGVGSAGALVLASDSTFTFPTDVEPSGRWYVDDVVRPEFEVSGGYILLPSGPGLGYEVDARKLKQYKVGQ